MKKFILIFLFSLTFLLFLNSTRAQSIIGETYEIPFSPNQRAICRDAQGIIHVVWRKNSATISYANSSDGINWLVSDTKVNSTGSKGTPSISCNGNNITIAYRNGTGVVIYISENNGASFITKVPYSAGIGDYVSVERRGQRIYVVYQDSDTYNDIEFFNSSDGGTTWGPKRVILDGRSTARYGIFYYEPSIAVDGNGGTNDKIYVVARRADLNSLETYYYVSYVNSSNSGVSWGIEKYLIGTNLDIFYMPSITYNGSKIYISYYSGGYKIYFNSSSDYGSTWSGERIDTLASPNRARYPSVTINNLGNPLVFWEQDETNPNFDIVYRKYNGTHWENVEYITKNNFGNNFVNTPYTYYQDNKIHYVWRNGTSSPYRIIYDFLLTYCDYHIREYALPYTIDKSNKYYCLASNEYTAGQTAISFAPGVQNTTLDCLNYNLGSNDTPNTYGIYVSSSSTNNTIRNCYITDFYVGVYLSNANNNQIINSTFNSNSYGIFLSSSSNNSIINSTFTSNSYGIYLSYSSNNQIINSTSNSNSYYGIYLSSSSNNTIHLNKIENNQYGIYLYSSGSTPNKIYNNLFNNTNNFYFSGAVYSNYWNTTRQPGVRIYSPGNEIGGNYWTNSTGNGFSDICNDTNGDGFCDEPLILDPGQTGNNTDYLPLSRNYTWIEIWIESDKKASNNKIISHPSKNILTYGYAFYVNMDGSTPYSEKPINFSYDGKVLGNNFTNSSGFYTFNFFINYEGTYTFKASAKDGNIYGENSTDLLIFSSPMDVKFRISYHLGNTKENDVYRIGNFNETINGLNISRILTSNQLSHAYVCTYDKTEYQEGLLLSLIHSYNKNKLNFVNFSALSLNSNYTLELAQRLSESSLLLTLTKGDCELIENKMYLVESQTIPSKAFSSFSFGLPIQNIFQIIASYDKIDLKGSLSFSKGSHLLCIEKSGISNAYKPIVEVRKC